MKADPPPVEPEPTSAGPAPDPALVAGARDRFSAIVGEQALRSEAWPYPRALAVGAPSVSFGRNLRRAGAIGAIEYYRVPLRDIPSVPNRLQLPYPDGQFDLVAGQAVIHRFIDVEAAVTELLRVLRPGGRFVLVGEPTRIGTWYVRRFRARAKRTLDGLRTFPHLRERSLPELRQRWAQFDIFGNASLPADTVGGLQGRPFVPGDLADIARWAGARDVRVGTEDLLAAAFAGQVGAVLGEWLTVADRSLGRMLPPSVFNSIAITGVRDRT